jgi:hypothetical protein
VCDPQWPFSAPDLYHERTWFDSFSRNRYTLNPRLWSLQREPYARGSPVPPRCYATGTLCAVPPRCYATGTLCAWEPGPTPLRSNGNPIECLWNGQSDTDRRQRASLLVKLEISCVSDESNRSLKDYCDLVWFDSFSRNRHTLNPRLWSLICTTG